MSGLANRLRRYHEERCRLANAGRWNAETEAELRAKLFSPKPRIRLGELGRRR